MQYNNLDRKLSSYSWIKQKFTKHVIDLSKTKCQEEALEEALKFRPNEEQIKIYQNFTREDHNRSSFFANMNWHRNFWGVTNYIKGVLGVICKMKKIKGDKDITGHINFMYMLGVHPREILYLLFTMGFRSITLKQILDYLNEGSQKKIKAQFMSEIKNLRKTIFQECHAEVLEQEKQYLIKLLEASKALQAELFITDPINERSKFVRLRREIESILSVIKNMHGIDEMREELVKAQAEIMKYKAIKKYDTNPEGEMESLLEDSEPVIDTKKIETKIDMVLR